MFNNDSERYTKHFISFELIAEYVIEIDDYTTDEQAVKDFLDGKYDHIEAKHTGVSSVDSILPQTITSSVPLE